MDREQPVLPMMPGVPERRTHSHVRHGTTSLSAALEGASDGVIGKCYKCHPAIEFLKFIKEIDAQIPERIDVHIVMDNEAAAIEAADENALCVIRKKISLAIGRMYPGLTQECQVQLDRSRK